MTSLPVLVSFFLIWILFFWFYREYRLDKFRQDLFELRAELFDFAAAGNISFEHHAYGMLRSTINGTIQYGHKLGLLDLLILARCTRSGEAQLSNKFQRRWIVACDELIPETKEQMLKFRTRLHYAVAEQVIFTSALLCFTLVGIALWLMFSFCVRSMTGAISQALRRMSASSFGARLMHQLDLSAYLRAAH